MEVRFNREEIKDKILACWIGKNIGGTIGTPFEGTREILDVKGFTSPKGEPLPNDDLDLQLVWLTAMEQVGPHRLSAIDLSDYWISYIPPHWNEYGVGKSNLKLGLLPPLSGECSNAEWKNSNGAWIRSEVWACMAPGFPGIAVKYAIMDACIDHGISEGTYAEIFTAALQSMAFYESDIESLTVEALKYIPEDCAVATSVKLVLSEYKKNTRWQKVREMLVKENESLGWFQAPCNVAYVILGLLYGKGDFKKSVLLSVNCGDDTDCTGATCASILSIIGGTKSIPEDWKEYVGEKIITYAVDASYTLIPKDCNELTDRIMKMLPSVLYANGVYVEYTDGEGVYNPEEAKNVLKDDHTEIINRMPNSFEISNAHTTAVIEYDREPVIKSGEEFKITLTLFSKRPDPHYLKVCVNTPQGWSADYRKCIYLNHATTGGVTTGKQSFEIAVTAGEEVNDINNMTISLNSVAHPLPLLIPITFLG